MILLEYKLKNGKKVNAYVNDDGYIEITEETLEIMVNGWNEGYQKARKEFIKEIRRVVEDSINEKINRYGIDIVEMYLEVVEDIQEWIGKQITSLRHQDKKIKVSTQ